MRKGIPVDVAAIAIDWLINQNPDKYRPKITSRQGTNQTTTQRGMNSYLRSLFIFALVTVFASLLILYFKDSYRTLSLFPFLIGRGIYKCIRSRRCRYCKSRTGNHDRVCDVCQMRTN